MLQSPVLALYFMTSVKTVSHEVAGTHVEIGIRILQKYGVDEKVILSYARTPRRISLRNTRIYHRPSYRCYFRRTGQELDATQLKIT
jgi:hypothetical protein